MQRLLQRGLLAATVTCGLSAAQALAGGSGTPWAGPLQKIVELVTGPVVQAAAVIAVVLFRAGIAMSENVSSMRRGLGILFGLSIPFAASTFFPGVFRLRRRHEDRVMAGHADGRTAAPPAAGTSPSPEPSPGRLIFLIGPIANRFSHSDSPSQNSPVFGLAGPVQSTRRSSIQHQIRGLD